MTGKVVLPAANRTGVLHFAAVERNTLQRSLDARQRFNYYPASPLPQLSWIFEGQLHLTRLERHAESSLEPALPKLVIAGHRQGQAQVGHRGSFA